MGTWGRKKPAAKKNGFSFKSLDVYADPALYEEMREVSGQGKAPTLTYGDLLLADFGGG